MKIHEYQAAGLLEMYGAPVSRGIVAGTPKEARAAAEKLGPCVLKAQVHCGGRGKAGGVKLAADPDEAERLAGQMLGMKLVSPQTGPAGRTVHRLFVTERADIRDEYYFGITGDMADAGLVLLVSGEGGTEIEITAKERPEAIIRVPLGLPLVSGEQVVYADAAIRTRIMQAAEQAGIAPELTCSFAELTDSLVRLYLEKDCSLVEINPLVRTGENRLLCIDAKVNFDDNALFRHPDILELRDIAEEDAKEYRASLYDLNFVTLDGNIGCLVNGAGLAMATMDIIKSFGGEPANFLDVGGSATADKVAAAFEILLTDGGTDAIFVNIFGGIMKCDIIAQGIIEAAGRTGLSVPLIVRLEGTNVEKGREALASSGLNIIAASDMADGARKAVEAAERTRRSRTCEDGTAEGGVR